jgi:hypothetical protein
MEPPVCVVTEPWIGRFRLPALDYERRVNRSDVTWTAQTSRAQDSAAIYLPGCISVWNPSKPQHHSSLGNPYPLRVFLPFFVLHTKNHATYFMQPKITFRNINFCLKKILYCFRSYLVAAWFSHTLLTTVLCSLSQQNLCCV